MRKPTKYEKETLIHWNEGEPDACVFTYNAGLKKRLRNFSERYPNICVQEALSKEGSVTYRILKQNLSVRLIPPYSEERRAKARTLAMARGFRSITDKDSESDKKEGIAS